jgi:hypothetical protein
MVSLTAASAPGITRSPVLLICPTRRRPGNAATLIRAWNQTGVCSDLIFCTDHDDPALAGYRQVREDNPARRGMVLWVAGPRLGLCGWTDLIAATYAGQYEALMSIGDDHVPGTAAFDRTLLDACGPGGFAYGDDGVLHRPSPEWPEPHNLPTACLITSNIIAGPLKGAMCLPGAAHMFTDAYWMMLAEQAGCRHFLPGVKVTHHHPAAGRAIRDQTYADGEASWAADEAVYRAWLAGGLAADAAAIRAAAR